MRFQFALALTATSLCLAACASRKDATAPASDPFFALQFAPEKPAASDDFPPMGDVEGFTLNLVLERGDLGRLASPRVTVYAGQRANVSILNEVPYEADTESGRITKTADDGLRLEAAMRRAADGGITIGFSVTLSRVSGAETAPSAAGAVVKPQMPDVERVEVSGVRWLEPGVQGLLARVQSPDGSGPMLILASAVPVRLDRPKSDVFLEGADQRLAGPMTGHTLHLRVSASRIGRDLEPGTVLDETAAPDVLNSTGGEVLRDFEIYSCLDSRLRLAGILETIGGARGLVAEGRDDGRLDLAWTTASGTRRATIRPNAGRRFVALARLEGGGTAGVIVSVDAD